MPIKTLGSLGKIRVGRVTGNTYIFFFGLTFIFEACRKCANGIDSFSGLDKYNIPVGIKTVSITFRVAVCIDAL